VHRQTDPSLMIISLLSVMSFHPPAHSVTYSMGNDDESFEWYNVRTASRSECRLMEGRVDILAMPVPKSATGARAAVEAAAAAKAARLAKAAKPAKAAKAAPDKRPAKAAGAPAIPAWPIPASALPRGVLL
jgi:hypothetical protein